MIKNWFRSLGTKATQGDTGMTSVNTTMPPKIQISNSPLDLMKLHVGIAYACSMKISNFISAVPLHVYAEVPNGQGNKLLTPSKVLNAGEVKALRTITKGIKIGNKGISKQNPNTEIVELYDHPLIDLMNRPNGNMSWSDWVNIIETYLSVIGYACVLIERKNGQIVSLHPLLSEYIWIHTDMDGTILSYEYYPSSQEYQSKTFSPDEIIHFRTPTCGSTLSGRGWIEACQKEILLLEEANNHQIALATNMGQPACIVTIHGKVGSKEEAEKVVSAFGQKFSKLRRGLPFVSFSQNENDAIEIKPSGLNPKELAYTENQPYLRSTVCACSGVPEDLIHSTNANRASSITAMQSFLTFTIAPRLNALIEQLNHSVAHEYDNGVFIGYNAEELVSTDSTVQSEVLAKYVTNGIMSPNEARKLIDLDPVEGGDELKKGGNIISEPAKYSISNVDQEENK